MRVYAYFPNSQQSIRLHQVLEQLHEGHGWGPFGALVPRLHGSHLEWIQEEGRFAYERLDVLEEIEWDALGAEADTGRIEAWEERLSVPLTQLVVADRNIGEAFVKGAPPRRSPMAEEASLENMRALANRHIGLFEEVFEDFEPDLIFTTANACLHSAILLRMAEHEGVPYYNLRPSRIPDRMILGKNAHRDDLPSVKERTNEFLEAETFDPPAEVEDYIASFDGGEPPTFASGGSGGPSEPEGLVGPMVQETVRRLWEWPRIVADRVLDPHPRQRSVRRLARERLRGTLPLSGSSWSYDDPPGEDEPYVLFPLQRTPEQSTMVLAPNYTNQEAVVELLAKNVPLSHTLVVKEHPVMADERPSSFHEAIDAYPNVRLVSPDEDTFGLIRGADLVAVVTGTAGWEAQFFGTPVLNLGRPHYLATGIPYHCSDPDELGETVLEAIQEGNPATEEERRERLRAYTTALFEASIHLPRDVFWERHPDPRDPEVEEVVADFATYFAEKAQRDFGLQAAQAPERTG